MKNKLPFKYYISIILLLTVSTILHAENKVDKNILSYLNQTTLKKFKGADTAIAYDEEKYKYEADGTYTMFDDCYEKVLTENGKNSNRVLTFSYSASYSKFKVINIEVISPDGSVKKVDLSKHLKETINRSQMSSNIYDPKSKVIKVSLPGLEINDTIHYVVEKTTFAARVPNTWSNFFVLESPTAINYYKIVIDAPKSMPLRRIKRKNELLNKITFNKDEKGDRILYSWITKDIQRIYTEPNMPAYYTLSQRLLVSTIPDWKFISKWYWNLCKPHLDKVTPEMKNMVNELTKGKTSDEEKINALFKFVSQKIRYMGITIETEAPGYEPHDVSLTFKNRYGVCRDKAALLVAMLREAGFKAYPVIINNGPKKDIEVPNTYFNHAIVAIEKAPGKYQLMDPTDENTRRIFPAYLGDKSYLVAKPEGETLLTSAIIPAEKNMVNISTVGQLIDNKLSAKTNLKFEGINDNVYRSYLVRIPKENQKELFINHIKHIFPGAKVNEVKITPLDLTDTTTQLSVDIEFTAKDFSTETDKLHFLPVPVIGTSFGMVNFILSGATLQKRKYPFNTKYACGVKESFSIDLGKKTEALSIPKYEAINTKQTFWEQKVNIKRQKLVGESEFKIKVIQYSPDKYLKLKETLKKIEFNKRKAIILKRTNKKQAEPKKESSGGIEILNDSTKVSILSENKTVTERTFKYKILDYKGKKEFSEVKISYIPKYQKVTLEYAKVINGDEIKSVSKKELHTMDGSWNGSAPRYPQGKVLVANLPAVKIGSVVEYKIKVESNNQQFFSRVEYFGSKYKICRKSFSIEMPINMDFDYDILNQGKLKEMDSKIVGDKVSYKWLIVDQPSSKEVSFLPPKLLRTPNIVMSTGNWKRYSRQINDTITKLSASQVKSVDKAKSLVANSKDLKSKIIAIRNFIMENIRLSGPAFTSLNPIDFSPADKTLESGYGNSMDRAILFKAMLQAVGVNSKVVIASAVTPLEKIYKPILDIPNQELFGFALVKVDDNSNSYYLNDTSKYAHLGSCSFYHKLSLNLESGEVEQITIREEDKNKLKVNYDITLDKRGNANLSKVKFYYGTYYEEHNEMITEMNERDKQDYTQTLLTLISQSAILKGKLENDIKSYPAKESINLFIPRLAVVDNQYCYFTLPTSFLNSIVPTLKLNRKEDLFLSKRLDLTVSYKIKIPVNIKNILHKPDNINIKLPNNKGSIYVNSYKIDDNTIQVDYKIKLEPGIFKGDEIHEIIDINKKLLHKSIKLILYKS